MNLRTFNEQFPTEESCREYLAVKRWNGRPVCQHCGSDEKIGLLKGGKVYKCYVCRKQFSVTKGTVMESSKIDLKTWFMASYILAAHKKGISSVQLAKDMGVTQKTAWFLLHRIRYGLGTNMNDATEQLTGIVEADETYVGARRAGKRGRGANGKIIVMGMHERGGKVKAQSVERANIEIAGIIRRDVEVGSTLHTDEYPVYKSLRGEYKHETVNHSEEEYVRGNVTTNNIEAFWSVMKRGIYGIYHQVSAKHMDAYVDEFSYRYNTRNAKDGVRFEETLTMMEGRLTYNNLTQQP